ncbi:uncharacterized protein KY384_004318 [Bacidia gigantensis]|uniref:uncharacterized protein n=1 Tax=Bacidia gigantensis TaxID=2732470 RepID=UPI001D040CF5|nr:uncharacterized protein KY384_004318 [Bacidia gigantensis]KAG8530961.1 hypothetical protein KY384_004318 [Bacidia gigantensis]
MSQPPQKPPSTPQAPLPNQSVNNIEGLQGLMSSLISPGPGTPMQNLSQVPWTAGYEWQTMLQNGPGVDTQNTIQTGNQASFGQNQEGLYEPPDHVVYSTAGTGPQALNITSLHKSDPDLSLVDHLRSTASSSANLNTPLPDHALSNGSSVTNNEASKQNEKKLNELRAKLLAKRPKSSRNSSPAIRPTADAGKVMVQANVKPLSSADTSVGMGITDDIESLVAEARDRPSQPRKGKNAALVDSKTGQGGPPKSEENTTPMDNLGSVVKSPSNGVPNPHSASTKSRENASDELHSSKELYIAGAAKLPHHPPPPSGKQRSSPDLSEGEIRSDDEQMPAAKEVAPAHKVSFSKEASLDSQEKSRRESEVEAAYRQPPAASRQSQEKLRRQSQVDQTYSPLKKPEGPISKPPKPPLDTSSTAQRKGSDSAQTPKSAVERSSRIWANQKARAAEYDSYVPQYRNPSLNGDQQFAWATRPIDTEARRRETGLNDKAVPNNRNAAGSRPQPERLISHTETTYLGRTNEDVQEGPSAHTQQLDLEAQISPRQAAADTNADLKDWLELTEYNDEEFRKSRLARFRKKKELEGIQLQLEQEERLELQQRSIFRSSTNKDSVLAKVASTSRLTLQTANNDTASQSSGALLDNQVTPTLKRHHAEDDTDIRNKVARVDNDRVEHPLPSSIADDAAPIFPHPLPLEHRMSRDDGQVGSYYRPQSRSPERYRRRSASPERRRYSVPEHSFNCHNCGQRGHNQYNCTLPRRDGKDRLRAQQGKRNDGISSKYQGKNPQPGFKDPRAKFSNVNRNIDDEDKRP